PDLLAAYQLGAHGGLYWPRIGLPDLRQHGLGIRHRGNADDDVNDSAVLFRGAAIVELEHLAHSVDVHSFFRSRNGIFLGELAQGNERWLGPTGYGSGDLRADEHLESRPPVGMGQTETGVFAAGNVSG